jgi:hypothetical protein
MITGRNSLALTPDCALELTSDAVAVRWQVEAREPDQDHSKQRCRRFCASACDASGHYAVRPSQAAGPRSWVRHFARCRVILAAGVSLRLWIHRFGPGVSGKYDLLRVDHAGWNLYMASASGKLGKQVRKRGRESFLVSCASMTPNPEK